MWTSVYMSPNLESAKEMRLKMENSEILVMFRSIKAEDYSEGECYELLVPSSELGVALDIIISE